MSQTKRNGKKLFDLVLNKANRRSARRITAGEKTSRAKTTTTTTAAAAADPPLPGSLPESVKPVMAREYFSSASANWPFLNSRFPSFFSRASGGGRAPAGASRLLPPDRKSVV